MKAGWERQAVLPELWQCRNNFENLGAEIWGLLVLNDVCVGVFVLSLGCILI